MNKKREEALRLEQEYEETRQAWNASTSHEERLKLSDKLNEIRDAQYDNAAEDWEEDEPNRDTDYNTFGSGSLGNTYDI